jgi:hypothetical protein
MFQLKSIGVWAGTALILILAVSAEAADVTLAWDATPSVAGYTLYWGTQPGVYSGNADVGANTSYVVTGLNTDTRYYFTVRAYNTGGSMSAPAKEVSGMTPPIAKPTLPPTPEPSQTPHARDYRITSADFDGDGRADMTIYRPTDGYWYILTSSTNYGAPVMRQWGENGDVPVAADYDGDGRSDLATWRPGTGVWAD